MHNPVPYPHTAWLRSRIATALPWLRKPRDMAVWQAMKAVIRAELAYLQARAQAQYAAHLQVAMNAVMAQQEYDTY